MRKPTLVLYSQNLSNCPCYEAIFNTEFELAATSTEEKFIESIRSEDNDAAVVCFCSAREEDADYLLRFKAITGPLPLLTCSRTLNSEFIGLTAKHGADHFLHCDMDKEKIRDLIHVAIQKGELKEYLKARFPGSFSHSVHVRRMIEDILHFFPHRPHESEIGNRLGISQRLLQRHCKEAFQRDLYEIDSPYLGVPGTPIDAAYETGQHRYRSSTELQRRDKLGS